MSTKKIIIFVVAIATIVISIIALSNTYRQASTDTHTFTHNYNIGVKSERHDMYERVNRGDLAELTHGDNQKALVADRQAREQDQAVPYKKSKDGNYWDWFMTHKSLSHGDDNSGLIASILGTDHPHRHIYFIDNQRVLEKHGINSGVNFE